VAVAVCSVALVLITRPASLLGASSSSTV